MARITVFVGVYNHKHGTDVEVHPTWKDASDASLDIAKEYWEDRADRSAPDDFSQLSRDEILDAYWDDNMYESFEIFKRSMDVIAKS